MGIQGLLPLLKSCTTDVNIDSYRNHTVAIDAYCWLHRAAYMNTVDIINNDTVQCIRWCTDRIKLLLNNNIRPILVFDGCQLPNKHITESIRLQQRIDSKLLGAELLANGDKLNGYKQLSKSIDITAQHARQLIDRCIAMDIEYIVAPYEADAQLTWLSIHNKVQCVISEDSDLIIYGCKRILFKMDSDGNGQEIKLSNVFACINNDLNLSTFTHQQLRQMCILSGCDYITNINGIGIKKSYQLFNKYRTYDRVIRKLRFDGKSNIPYNYDELYQRAELTYLHQRIYNCDTKQLDYLTPINDDVLHQLGNNTEFLGPMKPPDIINQIVKGIIDPDTHQPLIINSSLIQSTTPYHQVRIDTMFQQYNNNSLPRTTTAHQHNSNRSTPSQTDTLSPPDLSTLPSVQQIISMKHNVSKYFIGRNTNATQQPFKPPQSKQSITSNISVPNQLTRPYHELQSILPDNKKYDRVCDIYADKQSNQFYNTLCNTIGTEQVRKYTNHKRHDNESSNQSDEQQQSMHKRMRHTTVHNKSLSLSNNGKTQPHNNKQVSSSKLKQLSVRTIPKFNSIFISTKHSVTIQPYNDPLIDGHNSNELDDQQHVLSPSTDICDEFIQSTHPTP